MKIFLSNSLKNLYFYDNAVTIPFEHSKVLSNTGLSYILYCICNGVNDVDKLALELIDHFNVREKFDCVKEMVLAHTINDDSLHGVFTTDVAKANLSPRIDGKFGKKYPQILHIELTGTCNFSCDHCYKNAVHGGLFADKNYLIKKICNEFKGIVPVIHFTGGEPTLHKNFEELVNVFSSEYNLQLTTNGSQLITFSPDLLRKFQAIDVSLYGLTANEYMENTGKVDAFDRVNNGCKMLSNANIDFRVTLVLNNENWHQMENYVKYAIDVGAESIGFSLPIESGKILTTRNVKWRLSKETKRLIYDRFRNIQRKYSEKIKILDWYRANYSSMWKYRTIDGSLRCGAGKSSWWMSEKYLFRPCSFLPKQYLEIDYATWYNCIMNKDKIDWHEARNSLNLFASNNNLDIVDICSIFRK